jgi:branched-chain amino acid transport system ATP-binding protein
VLLLDEPAAGLNDEETAEMAALMRLIRESGTCTQVLIEHDMNMVMSTADRLVVLNFGEVLATGTADEIRRHPEVMSAYLGTSLE